MALREILLPTVPGFIAGAASGTQGTLDVRVGFYRIHRLDFIYLDGGAAPTDIGSEAAFIAGSAQLLGDIVVYKNSAPVRTHTAAELDHLQGLNGSQYKRQQVGAGATMQQVLSIFFSEPWRKSNADTDSMAVSVDAANGFNSFQVKLTLASAIPATGSFVVRALVDDPLPPADGKSQLLKKVLRLTVPASGTSTDITVIPDGLGVQTVCMKNPTGAYVQYVTVQNGGKVVYDRLLNRHQLAKLTGHSLVPQTLANSETALLFGFDLVFDLQDHILTALPSNAAYVKTEYSAAASGNVIALVEALSTW